MGNLVVCWRNKSYRQSVGEVFSFLQNSSRILEIKSVGEKFLDIETLAGDHPNEKDFVGDLSLPLVTSVCSIVRKCLPGRM